VVRGHRQFYAPVAASGQTGELVVQPANRETAPAVLYALVRLAHQVQLDAVAIFPSDHYVDKDRRFMRHTSTWRLLQCKPRRM
jgi:mannose-1-phosphate guanylyltransferase